MRKVIAVLAVSVLAITGAVIAIPAFAATKSVSVRDDFFSPKTITAKKGDRIKFTWRGDNPHNIKGAGINIGTRSSGTKRVTVKRAGTFVCTIHPGMRGRIKLG
jgi:plastocyanin